MTRALLEHLEAHRIDPPHGAPTVAMAIEPPDPEAVAAALEAASRLGRRVLVWGGGTHQGRGDVMAPDVLLSTAGLGGVIDYEPDDLTLVVGAATTLGEIERMLAERRLTAVLPENEPDATIGGVVAAGLSGWRRLRFGPTRDRILETTLATGDGRIVRGGGRVVKNVSGYDLPKLVTGSLGSLGVITSVCLKLWPEPRDAATVTVESPDAVHAAYRPYAVIETNDATRVLLGGRAGEVAEEAALLGGRAVDGFDYPPQIEAGLVCSMLVRPGETAAAVTQIRSTVPAAEFQAAHGVGEIRIGASAGDAAALTSLRDWAEARGGALVRTHGTGFDPWGTPPPGLELQRRVKEAFDPIGICNPGRLAGGL